MVIVTACIVVSILVYITGDDGSQATLAVYLVVGPVSLLLGWFSYETLTIVTLEMYQRRNQRRKKAKQARTEAAEERHNERALG